MSKTINIPMTKGEWNTIIHALDQKRQDPNNSKLAKEQYTETYIKLMDNIYGEGTHTA